MVAYYNHNICTCLWHDLQTDYDCEFVVSICCFTWTYFKWLLHFAGTINISGYQNVMCCQHIGLGDILQLSILFTVLSVQLESILLFICEFVISICGLRWTRFKWLLHLPGVINISEREEYYVFQSYLIWPYSRAICFIH